MDTLYLSPCCRNENYVQTCDGSYVCEECAHSFSEYEIVEENLEYAGT